MTNLEDSISDIKDALTSNAVTLGRNAEVLEQHTEALCKISKTLHGNGNPEHSMVAIQARHGIILKIMGAAIILIPSIILGIWKLLK